MNFKSATLIYFTFLFFAPNIIGQEMEPAGCFLEEKGRVTNRIIEDHYGFIWWMRGDGFFRFDGKEAQFINPSFGIPNSSFHSSANILPKENGDYWLAARELGIVHYDAQDDEFEIIEQLEIDSQVYNIYGRHITQVNDNTIFVSSNNGVWQIDSQYNLIQRIEPADIFDKTRNGRKSANEVRKTLYDKKRNLL